MVLEYWLLLGCKEDAAGYLAKSNLRVHDGHYLCHVAVRDWDTPVETLEGCILDVCKPRVANAARYLTVSRSSQTIIATFDLGAEVWHSISAASGFPMYYMNGYRFFNDRDTKICFL